MQICRRSTESRREWKIWVFGYSWETGLEVWLKVGLKSVKWKRAELTKENGWNSRKCP